MRTRTIMMTLLLCAASAGAAPDPDVQRLLNDRISVFDLYLGDLRSTANSSLNGVADPLNPLLAEVRYDEKEDVLYMFFVLRPDDEMRAQLIGMSEADIRAAMEKKVSELAALVGLTPLEGFDEPMGFLQMTPLKTADPAAAGRSDAVRARLAARTGLLTTMTLNGKRYTVARDIDGALVWKEFEGSEDADR